MPRQTRPDLAGVPQHVVQRGNDRGEKVSGTIIGSSQIVPDTNLPMVMPLAVQPSDC